jgi:alanyl-tRNA synthetase
MTQHMYYEDSYITAFDAEVVEQLTVAGKPAVVLDQTAFYPDSGGQPCDRGFLAGIKVEDVREDDSGRILHILAAPLDSGSVQVHGAIDWGRRFDHMQQHTGQHILSQAFLGLAKAATLSFHLGQETSTIDIDIAQPEAAMLQAVEDLAARIVFEDRPVHILNVTRDELSTLGVRKESQRAGEIRVIDIEDFDRSPCGGTHARRSGEIGLILILGSERYKGGTRVEFVCGGRALNIFRKDHEALRELGRLFSAHPHELPALSEKFLAERAALVREKKHLQEQLLEFEARDLIHGAERIHGIAVVRKVFGDRKIEELKVLAQKIGATAATMAILCAVQGSAQIVAAKSQDIPGDCGAAVRQLAAKLGGRGGGKPDLAQAGGIATATLQEWIKGLEDCLVQPRLEIPDSKL